jgi:iron complex outermembrane receptor protein
VDGTAINAPATYLTFPQNENEDTQNHELRITSRPGSALTWQTGLYYFKEKNTLLSYFGYSNTVPMTLLRTFSYNVGAESKAAFAQVGYNLTSQFKIEGGIRYSDDSKFRVGYNIVNGVRTDQNSRTKNNKVTWHAGVNFQATPRNLIYAKVDTGYKSGGFTDLNEYGPESLTAYEVGTKNRFLGNTLQLNLTGFYYDYKDLQVTQVRSDARNVILNAGSAQSYGLEFEAIVKPTSHDQLSLNVDYLHARYKNFAVAVSGVNTSYRDHPMIQAPTWSLAGSYQHDFDFAGGTLTPRIQSHFQTRSYFTYRTYASESQKAFTKTDFTLSYEPNGASWSVMAYVRNIEDRRIYLDISEYPTSGVYRAQFAEPRTAGMRLNYRF